jgi:riboflavin-specific deaminase-like protein
MAERPYVVASCAVSVDGYIDDASDRRLVLSNAEDLDRVDEVRAGCDAILVGAETVRRDDPRLLVRSTVRRASRFAAGRPAGPSKVTLTASGRLDPAARFFTTGDVDKIVYAAGAATAGLRERLRGAATVVDAGQPSDLSGVQADLRGVLADLRARGVRRLLVEGGGAIHTEFLTAGLVDELHLAVAPFFVGATGAPRFVGAGTFGHDPDHPMRLAEVRQLGDIVLLRYFLAADRFWLGEAVDLSRLSPRSTSAYAVGAVIVDAYGLELARGWSRRHASHDHAEEVALGGVDRDDPRLAGATLYTSLEPCTTRASRPVPCAELIVAAGIPRVVLAWREPDLFATCRGVDQLRDAGVEVVEISDLAPEAREVNAHLFG